MDRIYAEQIGSATRHRDLVSSFLEVIILTASVCFQYLIHGPAICLSACIVERPITAPLNNRQMQKDLLITDAVLLLIMNIISLSSS
jgi:hypothetical protein